MAPRKSWNALSPAYRARLERAGITAETHGQANLGLARGHSVYTLPRGRYAAPAGPTGRVLSGTTTTDDEIVLRRWFDRHAPTHLTTKEGGSRLLDWDTAAALSQVDRPPEDWESVQFIARKDANWSFVVNFTDGTSQVVEIPRYTEQEAIDWAQIQDDAEGNPLDIDVGS